MRQYEVTFIIDPVLPNEEIDGVAKNYKQQLEEEGCKIVHLDALGLRQLAYPISKRSSGIYYCIEFTSPGHDVIEKLELSLRRDERIMRFLTVKLDKYGVKYNADKRAGLIGKSRKENGKKRKDDEEDEDSDFKAARRAEQAKAAAAKEARSATKEAAAPVKEAAAPVKEAAAAAPEKKGASEEE